MTPLKWILLALGAAAVLAYVAWWYRTREEPVSGRALAAGLRAAVLLFAWLILLNPSLPASWVTPAGEDAVLLDGSHSMSRPSAGGATSLFSVALDSVGPAERVWLFGDGAPENVAADSLPDEPVYYETRLAPAVRAAALAGARRARVLSDRRVADALEATEEARRQGLALSFATLETEYAEAGIADVVAPAWAQGGDSVSVRVDLVAAGAVGDTLGIEIEDEAGNITASGVAQAPGSGRHASVRLAFPVSRRAGFHRYSARLALERPDPEPRDDRRVFYLRVSERPAGPVLISLVPDWEPSFLIANLERATDAPTSAYLWLADSLVSLEDYRSVPLTSIQARARQAPLLVVHGYSSVAPAWAQELVRGATRLLLLPAGSRPFELPGWDVRVGVPASGEWYASAELPLSPIALQLGGFVEDQLSPLLRTRDIDGERAWEPLMLRRQRRGEPAPAVVAGRAGGRRWVIATAEGYWRWAFRRGAGRQLYRALWTGVAGWLMEGRSSGEAGLQPLRRVVERGEALRWRAPGGIDSLTVELDGAEAPLWRGVAGPGDTLAAHLEPGTYRFRARAHRGETVAASAEGPAEVEEYSRELLPRPAASLDELVAGGGPAPDQPGAGRPRHLATLGWPCLLLIALFCAEWAVRRYIGLR